MSRQLTSNEYVESKIFVDRANGKWEMWAYVDYRRYFMGSHYDYEDVIRFAQKHGYSILKVNRR